MRSIFINQFVVFIKINNKLLKFKTKTLDFDDLFVSFIKYISCTSYLIIALIIVCYKCHARF